MHTLKSAAIFLAKAVFCLLLSYCLIALTLGHILVHFQLSFPFAILAIPAAVAMFWFFTGLESNWKK